MRAVRPCSAEETAECLAEAAAAGQTIRLEGRGTKARAGGPVMPADVCVTTAALDRVLLYEPRDLTMSVEAGMPFARLQEMLDQDGYMLPLDPPFAGTASVGGAVASNGSGPRRRLCGTARDLVIGMQFATLEGKLVRSGGMVVKNVAGLDMSKLMIGSMGTLAAITSVNFKLMPKPECTGTFRFGFASVAEAIALRDRLIAGVLQPVAIDILNPHVAVDLGRKEWVVGVAVSGNAAVMERWQRELSGAEVLEGSAETEFWEFVRDYAARFVDAHSRGAVVRIATTLQTLGDCLSRVPVRAIARAANGICYAFLEESAQAADIYGLGRCLMEFGPADRDSSLAMWPEVDSGFPVMQKIKQMFDPKNLLNRGRMYGRI